MTTDTLKELNRRCGPGEFWCTRWTAVKLAFGLLRMASGASFIHVQVTKENK